MKFYNLIFFIFLFGTIKSQNVFQVKSRSMEPNIPKGIWLNCTPDSNFNRYDLICYKANYNGTLITYCGRIIGLPGDTLQLDRNILYLDNNILTEPYKLNYTYEIDFKKNLKNNNIRGLEFNDTVILNKIPLIISSAYYQPKMKFFIDMDVDTYQKIKTDPNIDKIYITSISDKKDFLSEKYILNNFTLTKFGPIYIPLKEEKVLMTKIYLELYSNLLEQVNPELTEGNTYRFSDEYYFVLCDNRFNGIDSRILGLIPKQNIIGKLFLK